MSDCEKASAMQRVAQRYRDDAVAVEALGYGVHADKLNRDAKRLEKMAAALMEGIAEEKTEVTP